MKIIVLCPMFRDGSAWAARHKFVEGECIIVTSLDDTDKLRGIEADGVIILPNFFFVDEAPKIYNDARNRLRGR